MLVKKVDELSGGAIVKTTSTINQATGASRWLGGGIGLIGGVLGGMLGINVTGSVSNRGSVSTTNKDAPIAQAEPVTTSKKEAIIQPMALTPEFYKSAGSLKRLSLLKPLIWIYRLYTPHCCLGLIITIKNATGIIFPMANVIAGYVSNRG
jgi:hypothetical protein